MVGLSRSSRIYHAINLQETLLTPQNSSRPQYAFNGSHSKFFFLQNQNKANSSLCVCRFYTQSLLNLNEPNICFCTIHRSVTQHIGRFQISVSVSISIRPIDGFLLTVLRIDKLLQSHGHRYVHT